MSDFVVHVAHFAELADSVHVADAADFTVLLDFADLPCLGRPRHDSGIEHLCLLRDTIHPADADKSEGGLQNPFIFDNFRLNRCRGCTPVIRGFLTD